MADVDMDGSSAVAKPEEATADEEKRFTVKKVLRIAS
jgi:hypothetical protein